MSITIGRNDACHCGSGKKYKKCHLDKDESTDRKEREKAALNMAKVMAENAAAEEKAAGKNPTAPTKKPPTQEGWMKRVASKAGFFKGASQRRAPSQNKVG
jgi:hypothetical protein